MFCDEVWSTASITLYGGTANELALKNVINGVHSMFIIEVSLFWDPEWGSHAFMCDYTFILASYPGCCGGGKDVFCPHNGLGMRLHVHVTGCNQKAVYNIQVAICTCIHDCINIFYDLATMYLIRVLFSFSSFFTSCNWSVWYFIHCEWGDK